MTEKCKSMLSVDDATFSVVWENGCVVKTPFCKSIFTANCESGCAAIAIRNHNLTALPNSIVELKNMRRLEVRSGPLQALPPELDNLVLLTSINFKFNKLKAFNLDISKLADLVRMVNNLQISWL